jgi:chemosensory pili system protein ChpC
MSDITEDNPDQLPHAPGMVPEESGTDIPCMLLPLVGGHLLVPTVTVAEMAPIQPFDIKPNTPDWFLGFFPWRNTRVPVISYETMNQSNSPKLNARGRVAVLNNTGVCEDVPFIGLLTQDIPRMTRVEEADIEEREGADKGDFDLMAVTVGMEELAIPHIEAIEIAIRDLNLARF